MNDLTFGATLLSFFAMLIVAVVLETSSVPAQDGARSAMAHTKQTALQIAKASAEDRAASRRTQ
jgi:hypothetical protein